MPDHRSTLTALFGFLSGRAVRVLFVMLAVALAVRTITVEWSRISTALDELSPLAVALSLGAILLGMSGALAAWRTLLAGLGTPLPWGVAGRVLFVAQLGKYVPGGVWPMVAQMELGRDHGVPRRSTGTVFVLLTWLNLVSALAVACVILPFADLGLPEEVRWSGLLAPVFLAGFHPRVLTWATSAMLRLTGRPPLERAIDLGTSMTALAAMLLQWTMFGLHVLVLASDLGAGPAEVMAASVGGFALAWAVGPLLVIAPAGLGFREVTLVLVLAPTLGAPAAIVVAICSRLLMTSADLLLAGSAVLASRLRR